jgi:hypothetical protein
VKHRFVSSPARPATLALLAGLATSLLAAAPASAISDTRLVLRWSDWSNIGVLGETVVIGSLDGGQPNVNHESFNGANIVQVAYPLPFQFGDQVFERIDFVSPHATAALGAIGARNNTIGGVSDIGGIIGFAPESSLIAGSFAATFNSFNGQFVGATNEAILFAMLGLSDQDFADAIWQPLGMPERYRVASVVNLAFGSAGSASQRGGTDVFAQLAMVAASQTRATWIGAGGNQGANPQLENPPSGQPEGSMASPASAQNIIAVGFTEQGLNGAVTEDSSRGPQAARDWRVDSNLLDPNADYPLESPPPSTSPVFNARNGVEIVAPGVEISLPGSPAGNALNNTNFSAAWTGTSFSSAIVAGAVGLLHDLHRQRYFAEDQDAGDEFDPNAVLAPVVTKAILLNSANKEQDWSNGAQQGQGTGVDAGATTTTTPFDPEAGAGRLDMRRLLRQYLATPGLGGYRDITPETLDINGDPLVEAFRRNPDITDPADPRMDQGTIPSANPLPEDGYILLDEDGFGLRVPGTEPDVPLIQTFLNPDSGEGVNPGGGVIRARPDDGVTGGRTTGALAPAASGPHPWDTETPGGLEPMQFELQPPNGGEGLDTPGGGSTGGGSTGVGGLDSTWGAGSTGGGSNHTNGGGGTGGGQLYSAGWDHGMIGKGTLDLPIGLVSEGSTISATLTWQRRMILDQRVIDALAASVLPQNAQIASDILMSNPDTQRAIREAAPFLPKAKRALEQIEAWDGQMESFDGGRRSTKTVDGSAEPTVMAGVFIPADATDPPLPPADSDTPAARVDPNNGSPFRGVCFIEIPSIGRRFTGVAIGPRQILTAAHPFDTDNNGTRDTAIADLRIVFNGAEVDDGMGGTTFQTVVFDTGTAENIVFPDGYVGIGLTPLGQNRGFENDLAVITLRADANGATDLDIEDLGVFVYPRQGGMTSPGSEVIIVGYGESGQGDEGFTPTSTLPILSSTKRVGGNIVDIVDPGSYEYDFDGPVAPFIEGPYLSSQSIGNRNDNLSPGDVGPMEFGETLHGEGDSGSPAFVWFDSGDGMGGPADGRVQVAELRVFGINTYRRIGFAQVMGGFGAIGGGQTIAGYEDFIQDALDPEDPPPPGNIGPDVVFNNSPGILFDLVGFDFQKLNLELWRLNFDGSGNRLTGSSTSEWEQTEIVRVTGQEQVPTGTYFLRIVYEGTQWDFGGFRFAGIDSIEQFNSRATPYANYFDGDIEYGIAWYCDLINDPTVFPTRSVMTHDDFMGDMNQDGDIDGEDLGALLSLWGTLPETGRGDLNGDGAVDAGDLSILLGNYTGPKRRTTTVASN